MSPGDPRRLDLGAGTFAAPDDGTVQVGLGLTVSTIGARHAPVASWPWSAMTELVLAPVGSGPGRRGAERVTPRAVPSSWRVIGYQALSGSAAAPAADGLAMARDGSRGLAWPAACGAIAARLGEGLRHRLGRVGERVEETTR